MRQTPNGIALPHLQAWRLYSALSQGELASKAGVYVQTVRDVEAGKRRATFNTIGKLARALGVDRLVLVHNAPTHRVA